MTSICSSIYNATTRSIKRCVKPATLDLWEYEVTQKFKKFIIFDLVEKMNITKIYMNGQSAIPLPYLSPT